MTVWVKASEDDEENFLADYCDMRGWKHTHFSNETYTTSWKQKNKMKYLGVHSGVPDHFVLVIRKNGQVIPVWVEMKRKDGGTISDNQFDWISSLLEANQYATVCYGGEEATRFLRAVEDNRVDVISEFVERFKKKREKRLKTREKQEKAKKDNPF